MNENYVSVLVQKDNKAELHRIDITDMSITELSKLREKILREGSYSESISLIDNFIREKISEITLSSHISSDSYIRKYKKNKKETKQRKRTKSRRIDYDKYQRK